MAVVIRWLIGVIELPLLERVFWSGIATFLVIGAVVWALLLLNGAVERHIYRRLQGSDRGEITAMLRLARRIADVLVDRGRRAGDAALLRRRSDGRAGRPGHRRNRRRARRPEDARKRHRRSLHHLRQGRARGRLPQARRDAGDRRTTSACVRPASARWIAPSSASPTVRSRT